VATVVLSCDGCRKRCMLVVHNMGLKQGEKSVELKCPFLAEGNNIMTWHVLLVEEEDDE